jgi:hypothetical protein
MKKYISIITVFFTIGMAGCKKGYLDQEVNPNQPSVTTPQYTLSGALVGAAAIISQNYPEYGVWGGYICNANDYVPNPQLAEFAVSVSQAAGPDKWTPLYENLTNFNNLQTASAAVPADANFEAIAMIMKAYDFEQLVDNFNDVPYTQAFQPATILFPAYDTGQSIYNDLVKQLDNAIALINKSTSAANPGSSDVVYQGNMTNWKKFANTLKLRLAIRQSNLSTNTAQADLASTASEGYIDASTEADCQPGYSDALGKENPFYSAFGFDQNGNPTGGYLYYQANIVAINMMTALNDPRLTLFYLPVPGAAGNGILGDQLGNVKNNPQVASSIGTGLLKSPAQPQPLIGGYEGLFLQAEAFQRGWITAASASNPSPAQLYNAGITASFNAVGAPAGSDVTYEAQPSVAYPTGGGAISQAQQQAIITQKYLSLNGYFYFEGYNEFRRTGYPALPQNPASADVAALSQTLPTRIPYPFSEVTTNNANLQKEPVTNIFTSKIFWAK